MLDDLWDPVVFMCYLISDIMMASFNVHLWESEKWLQMFVSRKLPTRWATQSRKQQRREQGLKGLPEGLERFLKRPFQTKSWCRLCQPASQPGSDGSGLNARPLFALSCLLMDHLTPFLFTCRKRLLTCRGDRWWVLNWSCCSTFTRTSLIFNPCWRKYSHPLL